MLKTLMYMLQYIIISRKIKVLILHYWWLKGVTCTEFKSTEVFRRQLTKAY